MKTCFTTIYEHTNAEIIEKKSRFIANIAPVQSEEDAIKFIEKIKKQHFSAKHNCYAYIINGKVPIMRFSDDKEPQGTAGKPILDILISKKLENIVAVITRYFGGILLGKGGLIRAYSLATKEGINKAKIITIDIFKTMHIYCDYAILGKIKYELESKNCILSNIIYTDNVEIIAYIKKDEEDFFKNYIQNISNNTADIAFKEDVMLKLLDNQII